MKRNLLRSRDSHGEERVGSIELFFDLVFVFAVSQLSHHLLEHQTWQGAIETLVLEERDGQTTVITTTVHKTMQNRDGHLANGAMEVGMNEGYARLDELLPQLRRAA